jgi:hypothetical protein
LAFTPPDAPSSVTEYISDPGTDADWVVKLIDVYPDPAPALVESGYQFMVSGDIFRGRYRENYEKSGPIEPDVALEYTMIRTQRISSSGSTQITNVGYSCRPRAPSAHPSQTAKLRIC